MMQQNSTINIKREELLEEHSRFYSLVQPTNSKKNIWINNNHRGKANLSNFTGNSLMEKVYQINKRSSFTSEKKTISK